MRLLIPGLLAMTVALFATSVLAGDGGCCASKSAGTAATSCGQEAAATKASTASLGVTDLGEDIDLDAAVESSTVIATALSNDQMDGVAESAQKMAKSLGLDLTKQETMNGQHQEHTEDGLTRLSTALEVLADESTEIAAARDAYMIVQESFIPLANHAYTGDRVEADYGVYYCGMVKASWIQAEGPVANPYYGSKMLRCGSKVAALGTPPTGDPADHGSHAR